MAIREFSVSTQLSQAEYCKLFLKLSYRQRLYQIITIMGVLLLLLSIIRFFTKSLISANTQMFLFAFSIYGLVLFPLIVWFRARKIYRSSAGLQRAIHYKFTDSGVSLDASGISSSFSWTDFGKTDKTKNYLLLFGYNRAAYFLKLKDLNPDQITFIEAHVQQKEKAGK